MNHELEMMVQMFNPKILQEAYSLAKLQKAIKQDSMGAIQNGRRVMYINNSTSLGFFLGVKLNMAESDGVQGHVIKSLPTFVKKPLNLTSK